MDAKSQLELDTAIGQICAILEDLNQRRDIRVDGVVVQWHGKKCRSVEVDSVVAPRGK
jgi:ribulose 1,5-bisphosphate synthetase/thiazole synthase